MRSRTQNHLPIARNPLLDGFSIAPEWIRHARTWLSWPCRQITWRNGLDEAQAAYERVIRIVSQFDNVGVIANAVDREHVFTLFSDLKNVTFFITEIDDSWIRDNGPTYLANSSGEIAATAWRFNAWGQKFWPYADDATLAGRLCEKYSITEYPASLVCEGGSINGNGQGTLLTTESVLLNPNRNSGLTKKEVTQLLSEYTGCANIIWLPHGLCGDETDGHVDNVACFVSTSVIMAAVTEDRADENYGPLNENLRALALAKDRIGKNFEIVKIPLPPPTYMFNERLTASYINFVFLNEAIMLPAFGCSTDRIVASIWDLYRGDRAVIPVEARDICVGGGGPHCITLNQPKATRGKRDS